MKKSDDDRISELKHQTVCDISGKRYWSINSFIELGVPYDSNRYDHNIIKDIISVYNMNNSPLGCKFKKFVDLQNTIVELTGFLDKAVENHVIVKFSLSSNAGRNHKITMAFRIYCILNDICGIEDFPRCLTCGKTLPNFHIDRQCQVHYRFCSIECKASNEDLNKQSGIRQRNFSDGKKSEIKRRRANTNMMRYGNSCFMKTKRFNDAKLKYIKANGGENNVSQIREVRRRVIATNIANCGYSSNLASPECLEKKRQTYIRNYGVDNNMKSETGYLEWRKSFVAKNRVVNPFCLERVRENAAEAAFAKKNLAILNNIHVRPLFDPVSVKSDLCLFGDQYWWECLDCGHVFAACVESWSSEYITICPFCKMKRGKAYNHSNFEFEVVDFVRNEINDSEICVICGNNSVNRHIIAPYELDIYIPKLKLAFECEGLFWHSQELAVSHGKEYTNRIMEKTLMCENIGVHLVHVYQDEWADEQDGVRTIIRNILKNAQPSGGDIIVLPRDKYPVFYDIPGYQLDSITEPKLVSRHYKNRSCVYTLYNCGNLIYKKIDFVG